MESRTSQTPDLASVLAQLRQYAPAPQQNTQNHDQHSRISLDDSKQIVEARASPRPPVIDATSIVDWPAGIRCVSKAAAQTPWFTESIQKMIRDQRRHEQQWYIQRQNLKQQLAKRGEGAKQAQDVLKSLGSFAKLDTPVMTPEDQETELKQLDAKIYKAQCDMANVMGAELKALGVPFFGTRASLVVKSSRSGSEKTTTVGEKRPTTPPEVYLQPGQIEEAELVKLQRRMLEYLEDMYKD